MKNKKIFDEIYRTITENNSFFITSHINPDGDAIGSELAFFLFLKKLKKKAIIVNHDTLPKIYNFLPGSRHCMHINDIEEDMPVNMKIALLLDSSNLNRTGEIQKVLIHAKKIINIDHHCSNNRYGGINYVDITASSTGEIIFDFINYIRPEMIDEEIATCLYTAIITDTGSFRYENTSKKTYEVAAKLVSIGIKPHIISQNIYNRKSFKELKLLGAALSTLETDKDNFASWVTIDREMLKRTNSTDENTEGIIETVSTLKNSEVFLLFRETDNNATKVSIRSKGHFNVNKFALKFNGGGHPNAAGCMCRGNVKDVKDKLLDALLKEKI